MSEHEFEAYLNLLARTLRLSTKQRDRIANELRDHMEARLNELIDRGVDRDDAVLQALDEFGDANLLADDLARPRHQQFRRKIMQTGFATVALAACAALAVVYFTPTNQQGHSPQASAIADDTAQEAEVSAAGAAKLTTDDTESVIELTADQITVRTNAPPPQPAADTSIEIIDVLDILARQPDGRAINEASVAMAAAIESTIRHMPRHRPEELNVTAFEGMLIVSATPEAHEDVERLLMQISEHMAVRHDRAEVERREAEAETNHRLRAVLLAEREAVAANLDRMNAVLADTTKLSEVNAASQRQLREAEYAVRAAELELNKVEVRLEALPRLGN
ncbi:MAG: permease prefix domain 1-containing protein [Planctomycetota bacterium]